MAKVPVYTSVSCVPCNGGGRRFVSVIGDSKLKEIIDCDECDGKGYKSVKVGEKEIKK